jgi:hypothetical protein
MVVVLLLVTSVPPVALLLVTPALLPPLPVAPPLPAFSPPVTAPPQPDAIEPASVATVMRNGGRSARFFDFVRCAMGPSTATCMPCIRSSVR